MLHQNRDDRVVHHGWCLKQGEGVETANTFETITISANLTVIEKYVLMRISRAAAVELE